MKLTALRGFDLPGMVRIAGILRACGRDMAAKYGLHHWDNSRCKTLAIVLYGALKHQLFLVRDDDGVPVATFQLRREGDVLFFSKLATLPAREGQGIGSFCLRQIEAAARGRHCGEIRCAVYAESAHAISFYESRGFCRCGERATRKYREILMKKEIL